MFAGKPQISFEYEYDELGNIVSEKRVSLTTTYAYDALGQLIRVNDPNDTTGGNTGTTWVYEYDRGGNILSKKRYAYAAPEDDPVGTPVAYGYEYEDANWKDKLTKFNGTAITYDQIGNPLSDGTWSYTWAAGRQLQQIQKTGMTVQFQYNHVGLRMRKAID